MNNVILHNPRCSKSRQALALLHKKKTSVSVREYLKDPLTENEISTVLKKLRLKPADVIRTKEPLFKDLKLSTSDQKTDQQWIKILAKHPKLLERPILLYKGKAVIGRPPENVLEII